jgi:hypothetical protein
MSETTNKPGSGTLAGWGAPGKSHAFCRGRLSPQVETAAGLAAESAAGAFGQ